MNKREIMEIKRRFKKESCSIQHMAGCYVDAEKNKLLEFHQNFLNLEEEEFFKYLDIANKGLSGTIGNNLITLEFPLAEEASGGKQQSLMALRASKLEDDAVLSAFFDHVIETYDYLGNYLITLFYDAYDIPMKTSDNLAIDDSEEVYEYILCCICPVALSKPALGYLEKEGRIGSRIRDWVVGATDTAFLFPAFNERTTDLHSTLVYTKNVKEPHQEFWENGLGCNSKQTATQKRSAFENMIAQTLGADDEKTNDTILDVQQNLNDYILLEEEQIEKDASIPLEPSVVSEILEQSGISERKTEKIVASYENYFEDALPDAKEILDAKAIKSNEVRVEKKHLEEQVIDLTKQLKDAGIITRDGKETDIVVKVSAEKVPSITTAFVDGKRCLVIPIEADEVAKVNGEDVEL